MKRHLFPVTLRESCTCGASVMYRGYDLIDMMQYVVGWRHGHSHRGWEKS